MALRPCRECGREVSTEAKTCPHCGVGEPAREHRAAAPDPWAKGRGAGDPLPLTPRAAPHTPSPPTPPSTNGRNGCLVVVAILILMGIIGQCSDEREVTAARTKATTAAQEAEARALSSYLNGQDTTRASMLTMELSLHGQGGARLGDSAQRTAHDARHPVTARLLLDSAAQLLRRDPSGEGTRGTLVQMRAFMATAKAGPMTRADTTRARALEEKLAVEDRRITRVAARLAKDLMIEQRRQMANALEKQYLDNGMDVTVRARGSEATTLELRWVLVSRVVAHQFSQNTELWTNLNNAGFKKLIITDGYNDTWSWNIP